MATLVQIINQIKTLASNNKMIRETFFGSVADRMAISDVQYPLFAFDLVDAPLETNKENLNFQFWFLDLMKADKTNEEDALSDMIAISNDMVAALNANENYNRCQIPTY